MKSVLILFLSFLFIGIDNSNAQVSAVNDPFQNPVILSHYPYDTLLVIRSVDPVKFNTIVYYYTSSFKIEPYSCNDCIPRDPELFDISEFEYLRRKDVEVTRKFSKYGFTVTLLPVDQLTYKLPVHSTLDR